MNRSIKVLVGFFVCLIPILIYAPTFLGIPLWDDHYFIFDRYHIQKFSYFFFWRNALWPFFESTTLTLFKLFGENTLYWHLTNFLFHILNGLLLGRIIKQFKPSFSLPLTLIFWVHPLCVLSVSWIVQLKTLMSLFFSLLSIYLLVSRKVTRNTLFISSLFFILSITSKSATLVLPFLVLIFVLLKKSWRHNTLTLIPFVIISLLGLLRMSGHDDLQLTIKNSEATLTTLMASNPEETTKVPAVEISTQDEVITNSTTKIDDINPTPLPRVDQPIDISIPEDIVSLSPSETLKITENDEQDLSLNIQTYIPPTKFKIITYTASYYLAAPWLPYGLSPIHSNYRGGYHLKNYFGLMIIVVCFIFALRKKFWPIILLLSQLIILSPFLGLVIAPFMTFSIVSEQHLYIALPFAILAQLMLLEALFKNHAKKAYVVFFVVLSSLAANYTPTFKNEETFYRRVLALYPLDRLSALNLANHYFKSGRINQAVFILNKAIQEAEENPYLKEDIMHPYIIKTFEQMSFLK